MLLRILGPKGQKWSSWLVNRGLGFYLQPRKLGPEGMGRKSEI